MLRFFLSIILLSGVALGQITNVNLGTTANDGTGDSARKAFGKINTNVAWLASQLGSATNGVTTLSNAAFTAITSTSNTLNSSKFSQPVGLTTLYTLGDSIAYGASASTYALGWPALFAAANGLTEQRLAYGSGRIIDYYWQSQPPFVYTNNSNLATSPSAITGTQVWAIGMGDYNGMRDYGTSAAYQQFSKAGFLSLGVALSVTNKSLASAATASGTWTANTNLGGFVTATNSAATLTFTNIVGDTVYVAYIVTATNDFGSVSIAVNGTNYGTFAATGGYGNRTWDNGSDGNIPTYISPAGNGKLWYMPRVIRIPLGMSSKHTVVLTATGASVSTPSGVLWAAGNGQRRTTQNTGPIVLFSGTLRQATYTGSGSDHAAGQFAGNIRDVVDTLRGDGLAVYYVPSEQWFNEFTEMSGDNVHPNNAGHVTIATAFQDVFSTLYNPRTATGRAGFLPSGISIGRSPAMSGDLRLPQGSSIVWRNSGAFDGVSITNSGTALEIDAPNSSGSLLRTYLWRGDAFPMKLESYATFTAGSPIGSQQTVSFSMSSGDAILNQSVVTENNSSSGGFVVHDTALTRTSIGSGESSIYRAQVGGRNIFRITAAGRLLMDTATSGTGTSTRFGSGTDSSDTVLISYGTASVNREMQIGSGLINVGLNNGSGSTATLNIQSNGGNVTLGSVAVATNSALYVTQSATDRRMVVTGGSGIDVVLNSTGASGQSMTLNPSGGSVSFGLAGTTNQSMSWSGGTGTDRRLALSGNTIQVSLNSSSSSYQNLAVQTSGGDLVIGSSSSTGLRLRTSAGAAIFSGTGTPESAVTAPVGSLFLRTDGGAGSTLYVKETGSGNTGWAAK